MHYDVVCTSCKIPFMHLTRLPKTHIMYFFWWCLPVHLIFLHKAMVITKKCWVWMACQLLCSLVLALKMAVWSSYRE